MNKMISFGYGGMTGVTVSNITGWKKTGDLVVTTMEFMKVPIADVEVELELDGQADRITATRVVAGTALLGPIGAVAGVLAKKKVHRGVLVVRAPGHKVARYKLGNRKDIEKAAKFAEDFAMHKG